MHKDQDRRAQKKNSEKRGTRTSFSADSKTTTQISYHVHAYFKIDYEAKRSWHAFPHTANQTLTFI